MQTFRPDGHFLTIAFALPFRCHCSRPCLPLFCHHQRVAPRFFPLGASATSSTRLYCTDLVLTSFRKTVYTQSRRLCPSLVLLPLHQLLRRAQLAPRRRSSSNKERRPRIQSRRCRSSSSKQLRAGSQRRSSRGDRLSSPNRSRRRRSSRKRSKIPICSLAAS